MTSQARIVDPASSHLTIVTNPSFSPPLEQPAYPRLMEAFPDGGQITSARLVWSRPSQERIDEAVKRAMDLVVASILLLLTLPVLLLAMLAIKLTSPGPVIFIQRRCGKDGVPFWCFKFRTMVDGAERLRQDDQTLRAEFAASGNWKLAGDPRVTRVGRILRQTSVDELPQLVNVLRGEMSMVGPRPAMLTEVDDLFGPWQTQILKHKPGITGLWQVSGRAAVTYHERANLDLRYIESQSLWLDLTLLLRTIPAVLTRRGAL